LADSIQVEGVSYEIDSSGPIDISIPLKFNGPQPNAYGVEPATSKACEYGELVGDTRRGGSCNFEQYTLIPHCNGTHTECVGHITNERISVRECLQDVFVSAVLVSVEGVMLSGTDETYTPASAETDHLITRVELESQLKSQTEGSMRRDGHALSALVIRTLPNDESKLTRKYGNDDIPPYFTSEAMEYIVGYGFKHLLVDLPSIDRLSDAGKLSNHRIFWKVEQGSFDVNADTRRNSTITELIYVPDNVGDGEYLLNLQIAPFEADASPSRPVLFRLK
jgi:arylformamidase